MRPKDISTDDVIAAYRGSGNNMKRAAATLGISPTTVFHHLQLVGIKRARHMPTPHLDLLLEKLKAVRLEELRKQLKEAYGKRA